MDKWWSDNMAWLKLATNRADEASEAPVTVHRRTLDDYAEDVENAQRRIELKLRELEDARRMLTDAQSAFIAHCQERKLALIIETDIWPPKEWTHHD